MKTFHKKDNPLAICRWLLVREQWVNHSCDRRHRLCRIRRAVIRGLPVNIEGGAAPYIKEALR